MLYSILKAIHISTALLSISGFALRGLGMWFHAQWVKQDWVKIAPHMNDSLLLGTAIALAVMSRQYPLEQNWLTAKVVALILYIALGMMAFRFAHSDRTRRIYWLLALITASYIIGTAISRNPAWPLAL